MPKVIVQTDSGERVGEVEVFQLSKPTKQSYLGFDGIALARHWLEARRLEEVEAQREEYERA